MVADIDVVDGGAIVKDADTLSSSFDVTGVSDTAFPVTDVPTVVVAIDGALIVYVATIWSELSSEELTVGIVLDSSGGVIEGTLSLTSFAAVVLVVVVVVGIGDVGGGGGAAVADIVVADAIVVVVVAVAVDALVVVVMAIVADSLC